MREAIQGLFDKDPDVGISYISRKVGCSRDTARKWLSRLRDGDANLDDRPRSGRPRKMNAKMTQSAKQNLRRTKHGNLTTATKGANKGLSLAQQVSKKTVLRAVKAGPHGLRWGPEQCTKVSPKNVQLRRAATAPRMITAMKRNLSSTAFLDASFASFSPGDFPVGHRHGRAWGMPGRPARKPSKPGKKSVSFYAAIKLNKDGSVSRSPLLWVPPTPDTGDRLNGPVYTSQVCTPLLEWQREQLAGESIVWLQDGASPHTSKHTTAWQFRRHMETVEHPPQSPDLNPIERAWAVLKDAIELRRPRTWAGFHQMMQQEWASIDDGVLAGFIRALPSAMAAVHQRPDLHVKH